MSLSSEWINELPAADRYRPMMRLLDNEDFEFLRTQPGMTPLHLSRMRSQRCQILRGYLRSLDDDFREVSTTIKQLIAQSSHDRAELAALLLKRQVQFTCSMLRVQCRLVLFRWGFSKVDVSGPLQLFDRLRIQLASMRPAAPVAV